MKNLIYILFFSFVTLSCNTKQKQENIVTEKTNVKEELYANEYGEVRLIRENDTLMRTIFKNNEGDIFDTTMFINYHSNLILKRDTFPLLQCGMAGIELHNEYLYVHDFSNMATMSQFTRIENIYTRPFYKLNDTVTIKGDIISSKGLTIDGIWLNNTKNERTPEKYIAVKGIIKKEKYPIDYYSTDESPQGMFSDTNIIHYRLIMNDYSIQEIPTYRYKGTTFNQDNQAAFIYEFADSELFFLDNKEPWPENELNKEIVIDAVLVQFINGKSVLKNWEIIDNMRE